MYDLIVVGAGVAGLSAAQQLSKTGWDLLVLEKSRGLGGRAATRRLHGTRVDHGAQYFTARDPDFQAQVDAWLEQGVARVWRRGFHTLDENGLHAPGDGHPRYIFPEGMNKIGKLLAEGVNVKRETRVGAIHPDGATWKLETEDGQTFQSRYVLVNTPAEQAVALCRALEPELRQTLEDVELQPCFALMLGYPRTLVPKWTGIRFELENSPLSWLALDSSKRPTPEDTVLVAHSTHNFAREYFTADLESVKSTLLSAVASVDERFATPQWTDVQRWRYAQANKSAKERFLRQDKLLFCGDWCGGAKLEDAYLSGLAAARSLEEARAEVGR